MSQLNLLSVDVAKVSSNQGDVVSKQGNKPQSENEFSDVIEQFNQAGKSGSTDKQAQHNGKHEPQAAKNKVQQHIADEKTKNAPKLGFEKPKDEYTLPVPIETGVEAKINPIEKGTDAHIIPVIESPLAGEISSNADKVNAESSLSADMKNRTEPTQVSKTEPKTGSDEALELLNMLQGAQKLIAKTSLDNDIDKTVSAESSVNTKLKQDASNESTSSTDKLVARVKPEQAVTDISAKAEVKLNLESSKNNTLDNEATKAVEQLNSLQTKNKAQHGAVTVDNSASNKTDPATTPTDKVISALTDDSVLKDKISAKSNNENVQHTEEKIKQSAKLQVNELQVTNQNKEYVQEADDYSVEHKSDNLLSAEKAAVNNNRANTKQAQVNNFENKGNVVDTVANNANQSTPESASTNNTVLHDEVSKDVSQPRSINQATANVVGTMIKEQNSSTSANARNFDTADSSLAKSADNTAEEVNLAKTASEKSTVVAERTASMMNQTLDANASRSTLTAAELSMQQEQSFENSISKLSSNAVQTQKSITALNTETIAIYRKDFANAVKDKVMVMINQKIQQVEIQLDPPEMGNVHVRVNLQNEQAAVQFIVQNQQAKDALEQNMTKLRDMLAENGVDVGDANIEQRQPGEQSETAFADGNRDEQDGKNLEQTSDEGHVQAHNVVKASSTGVDYYA